LRTPTKAVVKRLRWYWQVEAMNIVLVPAMGLGAVIWDVGQVRPALIVAALACGALLMIGALYWRAVLRRIEGRRDIFDFWLPRIAACEPAAIGITIAAILGATLDCLFIDNDWTLTRIATVILAVLAALEYVNYYKIQLQHFDNWADFRRLITGKGFRKSHMACDIAALRAKAVSQAKD